MYIYSKSNVVAFFHMQVTLSVNMMDNYEELEFVSTLSQTIFK